MKATDVQIWENVHPVTGTLLIRGVTEGPRCAVLKESHHIAAEANPWSLSWVECFANLHVSDWRKLGFCSAGDRRRSHSAMGFVELIKFWVVLKKGMKRIYLWFGPTPHLRTNSWVTPVAANPKITRKWTGGDQAGLEEARKIFLMRNGKNPQFTIWFAIQFKI